MTEKMKGQYINCLAIQADQQSIQWKALPVRGVSSGMPCPTLVNTLFFPFFLPTQAITSSTTSLPK